MFIFFYKPPVRKENSIKINKTTVWLQTNIQQICMHCWCIYFCRVLSVSALSLFHASFFVCDYKNGIIFYVTIFTNTHSIVLKLRSQLYIQEYEALVIYINSYVHESCGKWMVSFTNSNYISCGKWLCIISQNHIHSFSIWCLNTKMKKKMHLFQF